MAMICGEAPEPYHNSRRQYIDCATAALRTEWHTRQLRHTEGLEEVHATHGRLGISLTYKQAQSEALYIGPFFCQHSTN